MSHKVIHEWGCDLCNRTFADNNGFTELFAHGAVAYHANTIAQMPPQKLDICGHCSALIYAMGKQHEHGTNDLRKPTKAPNAEIRGTDPGHNAAGEVHPVP